VEVGIYLSIDIFHFLPRLCLRLWFAELQRRSAGACILTILGRAQVIVSYRLARNGVLVVERHHTRIRPEHRVFAQLIGPIRVVGIRRRQERHVVGLGVRPALLKGRVPEGEVLQAEDLPHAILLDVLILVDAALPPLYEAPRMCVLDALVGARRHHAAEAALRARALGVYVDDALNLRVIKQEAVHGAIAAGDEGFGETADVQPLYALFAIVAAAEEFDTGVWMV
jgi:hypothetical protein